MMSKELLVWVSGWTMQERGEMATEQETMEAVFRIVATPDFDPGFDRLYLTQPAAAVELEKRVIVGAAAAIIRYDGSVESICQLMFAASLEKLIILVAEPSVELGGWVKLHCLGVVPDWPSATRYLRSLMATFPKEE